MNCLPGMPCYDDNIPPIIPDLVETSSFIGYPIISSFVYYSGTFLPNTGISTNEFLTTALQKIDPQISAVSIAEKILNSMVNNPTYNNQICQVVYECVGGTTSTTTTSSTSTTTSTSTSTTTSTSTSTTSSTSTTTTTTTQAPLSVLTYFGPTPENACSENYYNVNVTLNVGATNICTATIVYANYASYGLFNVIIYVKQSGTTVYRKFQIDPTGSFATPLELCQACSSITTTSTTSTTTTAEPTTTTTTTLEPTTTTTTTLPPSDGIWLGSECPSGPIWVSGENYVHSGDPVANGTVVYTNLALTNLLLDGMYVANVSGVYTVFFVSGGNGTLTGATPCSSFTTTTTTTNPDATTTTTTSSTSTTSTTTSTTSTTSSTSTTTTTTTQAPFSGLVSYGSGSYIACNTPTGTLTVVGDTPDFCTCTTLTSSEFTLFANGNYTVAYDGNEISVSVTGAPTTVATVTSTGCTACPEITTSTTTSTSTSTTTTSTSTSTTSTTSTTTTLPPVTLNVTAGCTGGEGTGTVLANGFSGGTESFEYISISSTSATDALNRLDNSVTRILIAGDTEYTFTSLGNATYYVAIMDFSGNKGVSTSAVVNCITITTTSTTTSTSTTTTTTTLPPYRYYTIDRRATCTTGVENPAVGTLRLPYAFTPILDGWYRDSSGTCTYSYRLSNTTPVAEPVTPILVDATTYTTSTLACGPNCIIVNFSGSTSCANVGASDAGLTITSFTGGSGVFDATPANTTYSTETAALGGTFDNVGSSRTYSGLATGTYWVAIRDRGNTGNKIAKSFTVTQCPPAISLGSAYCADIACMTPGGSAVVPCGGGYNVNIANAPSGYTVTMTYSVQGGPDGSYANLLNPSAGVYKVQAWFAAAGSNIVITLSLRNSSNVEVAQSSSIVSRSSPSNFLGLPTCSPNSDVVLSPQNSLDGNSYTVFINGVEDTAWNSGTRSYTAYTTIRVVYSSPACGVVLNGTTYTSNTTITLLNGTTYTFTLYNADHYVDTGNPYCEGCQRRQGTVNDCGGTSFRVLANDSCDCGVGCAGTYYSAQECSGNALIRQERYTCNNALTGNIITLDDCSCLCNSDCEGNYVGAAYCNPNGNYQLLQDTFNGCTNAYVSTAVIANNWPACGYQPPSIGVSSYSAFSTYNEFQGDWTVTIQIILNANVSQDTTIDATINTSGGTQTYGVIIYSGTSVGTSYIGYLSDPEPVGPHCLTFVSGDTTVTVAGFTC